MDIAEMSMNMSAAQLQQQVSLAVLDLTMDTGGELAALLTEEVISPEAAVPATGHIDITA